MLTKLGEGTRRAHPVQSGKQNHFVSLVIYTSVPTHVRMLELLIIYKQ